MEAVDRFLSVSLMVVLSLCLSYRELMYLRFSCVFRSISVSILVLGNCMRFCDFCGIAFQILL